LKEGNLVGASVVVTGANRGIGRETALELAGAGYDVIGTVRSKDKAQALLDVAEVRGLALRTVLLDVADAAPTERGFAEIAELTGGGPWAVVNNAGFAQAGAIEDVDDEAVRYQLEVGLVAPARIARLVLPAMRERGDGRIVNMSSIAGRLSLPLLGWYCAAKHGLESMTDALRMEVAPHGVKVVLIEPGSFATGIWGGAHYPDGAATGLYGDAYEQARSTTERLTALMPGPRWVARTVWLALASPLPLSRYLVGLDAVGGMVAELVVPTAVSDMVKEVVAGVRRPFRRPASSGSQAAAPPLT
jgi:NAD(P)-dependent dehydrogenase (short-subunit alcohol dehydrogenase family)